MINKIKNFLKLYREYKIIKRSAFFDEKYYIFTYEDVRKADIDPLRHFIKIGWKEGRNPSPYFDTKFYMEKYEDVKESNVNPLVHYILFGKREGRKCIKETGNKVSEINRNIEYSDNARLSKLGFFSETKMIKRMKQLKKVTKLLKRNPYLVKRFMLTVKKNGISHAIEKIKEKVKKLDSEYQYKEPILTEKIKEEIEHFFYKPLISVIMPVYNVDPRWLDLAIKSVEKQWYHNWELCIVDDASTNKGTKGYLKRINDPKIKIKFLKKNQGISGASNEALELAEGEYIALLDHDDELTPDALYEVVKAINKENTEFIYSDEDKIEMDGSFVDPHFKPDFAPDMLLSQNYLSHLGVIKKELVKKVGGWESGLEGSQDYDLYLKVTECTNKIFHIPKVLYHWRKVPGSTAAEFNEKSYAQEAGRKALENAVKRRGIKALVKNGECPGTYKIEYEIINTPLVSIIIPFKDHSELIEKCARSILKSTYKKFEIIGISNNSREKETFETMKKLEKLDPRIKFYEYNIPFNYSKINNYAVENLAKGEHIVLMNNDIEIITPSWIEEMLMFSQREDVGAVGAKLYYPDGTIQHAGVILGIGGVAGHSHKHLCKDAFGYFCRPHITQNISAVTAALMMIKRKVYLEVGGFDEKNLEVAFNDVDFCLRVREKGYLNVFTPWAEAYHYESKTRGYEDTPEKQKRFKKEIEFMRKKWGEILLHDPYYNPNLTLDREDFSLRI